MHIPLRTDLTLCVALPPMRPDQLPPVAESDDARAAQIQERATWMSRDLAQAGVVATMCERLGEMNDLVSRNNAEAER